MGFEAVRVGNLVRADKALEVGLCLLYLHSQISLGDIRAKSPTETIAVGFLANRHVWSAAFPQAKSESAFLVCAQVVGLYWSYAQGQDGMRYAPFPLAAKNRTAGSASSLKPICRCRCQSACTSHLRTRSLNWWSGRLSEPNTSRRV